MSHPLVTLGTVPNVATDPAAAEQAFLEEVLRGMASLCSDDAAGPTPGDLTLPLGMSAWIVRAAIGLPDAHEALMRLRSALVSASGLELRQEPVPLRVADPKTAICTLAEYLFGLVRRAARHAGRTPVELAESVLVGGSFATS